MSENAILLPMFAQVLLTAIVWVEMYRRRLSYVAEQKIDAQSLADAQDAREALKPVQAPANNLTNLFEVPVLFYAAVVTTYASGIAGGLLVGLAWAFVGLRVVHSLIQCTSNKVWLRFQSYAASTLVLWAMWVVMAYRLFL